MVLKNGQLLQRAATEFDCFPSVDRNLQFQQRIDALPLAVLVVPAVDNRLGTLRQLMVTAREALASIGKWRMNLDGYTPLRLSLGQRKRVVAAC
jgi:hypothetical protein